MSRSLLVGSALVALIGGCCGGSDEPRKGTYPELISVDQKPTTLRKIPAVEYKVRGGDTIIGMMNEENIDVYSHFSTGAPITSHVWMEGERPTVSYTFDFEDLIASANPDFYPKKGLRAGEVLTVPDLDRNGCISEQCGERVGEFVLTGNRTEETYSVGSRGQTEYNNEVSKDVEFRRK